MKTLFLDESGSHNLDRPDPQYPLFVLGGVVVDHHSLVSVERNVRAFKRDVLGGEDIVLRTSDIWAHKRGFEFLDEEANRPEFFTQLNCLMRSLPYTVIACVIKTQAHRQRYRGRAQDPYYYSLHVLVERLCYDLNIVGSGRLVAEKRCPKLDRALLCEWRRLRKEGTRYVNAGELCQKIEGTLELHPKSDNEIGLQLADLVVNPLGRHILGKQDHEDYDIVKSKLRRGPDGKYQGAGLKVLP